MRVEYWCHCLSAICWESHLRIMHHTSNIIRHVEVIHLCLWTQIEAAYTFTSNILPINPNVSVSVKSVLHVMETKGMNKFMNNRKESETATFNGMRLKSYSLRTSPSAYNRRTASWIASYKNVVWLVCSIWKSKTRTTLKVCSGLMNIINLITICN